MPSIFISHAVEDYDNWKRAFDDHDEVRREFGQTGYRLFNVAEDRDQVALIVDFDSSANARRFVEESDIEEVVADAGVSSEPEIQFLDEIEAVTRDRASA